MKIALGSKSSSKLKFLKEVISILDLEVEILPVSARSEVSEQPLSKQETIRGSINRAKNSLKLQKNADFGVGMEGGLHITDNKMYLMCAVSIYDKKDNCLTRVSDPIKLPDNVARKIRNGEQFGKAIREFQSKNPNHDKSDIITELVTRKKSFTQALKKAMLDFEF